MPQLNPAPWLFILFISWTTLLMIFKTKVLSTSAANTPTTPDLLAHHTTSWTWPWT